MCGSTPTIAASVLGSLLLACAHDGHARVERSPSRQPKIIGASAPKDRHSPIEIHRPVECPKDSALNSMATAFLQSASKDGKTLLALAREAHITDSRLHAWRGHQTQGRAVSSWLAALRTRSDAPLVCGLAQNGEILTWVAAERAALVEVDRYRDTIRAELAAGFHSPVLIVLDDRLKLYRREVSDDSLRQGVP